MTLKQEESAGIAAAVAVVVAVVARVTITAAVAAASAVTAIHRRIPRKPRNSQRPAEPEMRSVHQRLFGRGVAVYFRILIDFANTALQSRVVRDGSHWLSVNSREGGVYSCIPDTIALLLKPSKPYFVGGLHNFCARSSID